MSVHILQGRPSLSFVAQLRNFHTTLSTVLLEKAGVGLFIDFVDGRIKAALHVGEHIKRIGYKHLYWIHTFIGMLQNLCFAFPLCI